MATGSVILTDIYIHLDSNTEEYVVVQGNSETENVEGPEESRLMEGGNVVRSVGKGAIHKLSVTLDYVPRASIDKLRSWVEATLLIRDPRGRSWVGGIEGKALDISEHHPVDAADISFTFVATGKPYFIVED